MLAGQFDTGSPLCPGPRPFRPLVGEREGAVPRVGRTQRRSPQHAKRELELAGQCAEDPAYAQSIIAAVAAFASYGHSGGSAAVAIQQLHDLLQFRTLSPLTSDPEEWEDHTGISSSPLWQNRRDPAAMSRDGGQTWYFVDDRASEPADA